MAISKLFSNQEANSEYINENKDTLKSVLGLTAVGTLIARGMSNSGRKATRAVKDGEFRTELGKAGVQLKKSIDDAFNLRNTQSLRDSQSFFDDLIEKASSILKTTVPGALENSPEAVAEAKSIERAITNEKTYLLTAVRDAVRDLNLSGEVGDSKMLVDNIERILAEQMDRAGELSEDVVGALKSIRNNVSDEKRVEQFKRFKAMKENSTYFSGKQKATGIAQSMVAKNPTFNTFSEAFRASVAISRGADPSDVNFEVPKGFSGLQKNLEIDLDLFKKDIQRYGGNVQGFTVIKEHDKELASIMMQIGGRGKTIGQQIPLYASNVSGLRKVMRTTSSLATPNIMPSFIVPVEELNRISTEDISRKEIFNTLKQYTPERFTRKMFIDYLEASGGTIDDISEREINKLFSTVRMLGLSLNRSSLNIDSKNALGYDLAENLRFQQSMFSTQMIGYTTSNYSDKKLNELAINLMQKDDTIFDAPQASGTVIKKSEIKGLGSFKGVSVNLRSMEDRALPSSLNLIRSFSFKDRGQNLLTGREQQFYGREELLSAIVLPGDKQRSTEGGQGFRQEFGRGSLGNRIPMIGSNEALLSVDRGISEMLKNEDGGSLGKLAGANFAGILMFDDAQTFQAGIAEGQAYYGGLMEVDIPIQKSVLDPEMMKKPEYAFLRHLIERQKKGEKVYRVKRQHIASLFAKFSSERGEIPLGEIDNRIVGIKRYKDLQDLQLEINEVLDDKGTMKYHVTGRAKLLSERNKLFGPIGRVTSLGSAISEEEVVKAIDQSYKALDSSARLTGREIMDVYRKGFKGEMRNLIVTGASSGLDKRLDYVTNFMYGGYRMLGGREDAFQRNIKSREDAIEFAKKLYGDNFQNYERQISRAEFIDHARSIVKGLYSSGQNVSTTELGLLLAPMKYLEGKEKFGVEKGDLQKYVLDDLNVNYDDKELERVFATRLAIGAATEVAGSPPQILARNMAKFEPRHANILLNSLRTFFGLNSEQSVRYLNDFVLRQEGIEFSGRYLSDITTMGMGFTTKFTKSASGGKLNELSKTQFDRLQMAAQTRVVGDASKMDAFRQELISTLDYDNPTVLNVEDYVSNKHNLRRLNKIMPTGQLIIPSGRTIEGMLNYQIARGEGTENIDSRLIANLKGFFEHINELDSDPNPSRRFNALSTLVADTRDMSALSLRRSLSGSVLGSISMQGSGVIVGSEAAQVNLSKAVRDNITKQFERHKGYTIFTDTGGFMDSLNTFMGASTKTNIIEGATDKSDEINALTKKVDKFKSFMFGHLDPNLDPVRGLGLRNPGLGPTHMLPGIALSRFDVDKTFDVSMLLDPENKSFIKNVLSEPNFESIRKRINQDTLSGLTATDIYNIEKHYQTNVDASKNFTANKIQNNINDFNKNMDSFFGTNRPANLTNPVLTEEGLTENIKTLKSLPEYRTSKKLQEATRNLTEARASVRNPNQAQNNAFRGIYKNIIERFHTEYGAGGGAFIAPTFEAEIKIAGRKDPMRSRFDLLYSMIGDFDADTYQFFHETKNIMNEAMKGRGDEMIENISGASARFGIVRNLLNEAFNTMGQRAGSADMMRMQKMADEARKEVILKNVGSLDVQFKSMLLGMIENSLKVPESDRRVAQEAAYIAETLSDQMMGAFTSANLQEMGQIKAKKLPFAAEVGTIMANAVRRGIETGDTTEFRNIFNTYVLNNSPELKNGLNIEGVKLLGVEAPGVQDMYEKSLRNQRFSGQAMLEAMEAGILTAHKEGFGVMGSEGKLVKAMGLYGSRSANFFQTNFAARAAMELGMVGAPVQATNTDRTAVDLAGEALESVTSSLSRIKAGVQRGLSGKGMAGIIGASLVGSYALGANYSSSALSGPEKFSDIKVKNEIGNRAIQNNFNREHSGVPAGNMQQPQNLYQREILKKQMYVSKPSGIAVSGNVSSMQDGNQILQTVRSMGGQGHMSIQDNVIPRPNLADYYMRE